MVIQKKTLLESLKACMPGIESGNATLEGADLFVFANGKIFTYNDNVSVTVPIHDEGMIEEGVTGCVRAEEFFKVVSKFPGDEIKFAKGGENSWVLKCGKAKAEMTLLEFDYGMRMKNVEVDEDGWKELPEDFGYALNVCKMSVNKTTYGGIYFAKNNVFSTDGNQINTYNFADGVDLPEVWVSDKCVAELLKMKKFVSMQVQNNWAHFKGEDGTVFSVKLLNVEGYPVQAIGRVMGSTEKTTAAFNGTFPVELFKAIDRAASFAIELNDRNTVRLAVSREKIDVSAETNAGKYTEKVEWNEGVEAEFEPFTVYVDVEMINFVAQRTVNFSLIPAANGAPRLLFVTEKSKHLLLTFINE